MPNYIKEHGAALVAARYFLVPIKAGEKYPGKKAWPQIRATAKDVEAWGKSRYYGGLGVLGEFNPGIDIDVQDREVVEKLVTWCKENIGDTPIRTGNAPRVLIPCVAPPGGLGADNSAKYEDDLGVSHQIEIKATGQQWVAYGIHPGTKKAYIWESGDLHLYDSDLLPCLTGQKIAALFQYFESIAPSTWLKMSEGRSRARVGGLAPDGTIQGSTAFENYKPALNVDTDRVRSILAALSPDESEYAWRSVGMALYHQYNGSDEGKEIFREWSENSVAYDYDEILARWPSWAANTYGGNPITFASVIQKYNEATKEIADPTLVQKSKKLSDWEKRYCMVDLAESSEVHDTGVPIHKARRHTLRAFKEQNSGYIHRYTDVLGNDATEPMVIAWQNSRNVRHYAGYTYQPGKPRFCPRPNSYDDDTLYINNFYFPPHPDEIPDYKERLAPFKNLLNHLFPEEIERKWIIQWLARLIQNPEVRSFVTPINITPVTGTGRGILFDILRLLVGGHNTHDVSPDDIEGRFNGFLDKCLIAVIQEIKANTGARKFQIWERMKSLLADTVANIQAKGQDSYTAHVYANFLMFSNNLDALPLRDVNERRIYAMRGASRPLDNQEIDEIITWKKDELNISALFKYLKTYPVDENNFKRAPKTLTKIQIVNATVGIGGADIDAWLLEQAPEVFDYDYAAEALDKYSEDIAAIGMSRDRFRRMLLDKGYHSVQIRIDNNTRKYVYYHPDKTASDAATLRGLYSRIAK
jgi:hypothetical protein